MLIICGGMPRAGSTLQYNIARILVERAKLGSAEGAYLPDELDAVQETFHQWARSKRYHIIKTHVPVRGLEEWERVEAVRVLYIYRDLRDVAVSVRDMFGLTGVQLWRSLDDAIAAYYEFRSKTSVLMQKYECVVEDIPRAVSEIGQFLGIPISNAAAVTVAEECSLESVRRVVSSSGLWWKQPLRASLLNIGRKTRATRVLRALGVPQAKIAKMRKSLIAAESKTLLHKSHISPRNGASGAWRDELDDDTIARIETQYAGWLNKHGYLLEAAGALVRQAEIGS